jgi:hypothetical protein
MISQSAADWVLGQGGELFVWVLSASQWSNLGTLRAATSPPDDLGLTFDDHSVRVFMSGSNAVLSLPECPFDWHAFRGDVGLCQPIRSATMPGSSTEAGHCEADSPRPPLGSARA